MEKPPIDEARMKKNLAENMRSLRLGTVPRLTQETLAGKLGISQKSISKYEQAHCLPPAHVLAGMAECFGLGMDELLGEPPQKRKEE